MRKVHEKSIVLGIGIGMIITAIAGMIFSAGNQKELSKAEIISLAKGYGLIEQVQFLNGDNASNKSTNVATDSTKTADTTAATDSTTTAADDKSVNVAEVTDKQQQQSDTSSSSTAERNIIIEIKDGYKSQNVIDALLEKGVITNQEDFTAVLDLYKASTMINIGTFKFKKNDDLHYIVKTICNLK